MSKLQLLTLLTGLLVCLGAPSLAVAQTASAEGVQCSSTDGSRQNRPILFAAVQPTSQGYDLLMVDTIGKYIFTIESDFTLRGVSSIQGQELIPWNLTAYDGSPVSLNLRDGTFAIEMMVSSRSFCSFQGRAQFLGGL